MKKKISVKNNLSNTTSPYILTIYCFSFLCIIFSACENDNYPFYIKSNDHGVLWVANSAENTISCINRLSDETIGTYAVGPDPSRTAVDLDGNCWVGCRGDGSVYFVTKDSVIRRFEGFNSARGVALDQSGNVWIANSGNNSIQKISMPDTLISEQLFLSTPGNFYYGGLVDGNNNFWILDRAATSMIKYDTEKFPSPDAFEIVKLPISIYGFTIDTDNTVWVSGCQYPNLYKIDGNNAVLSESYTVPSELFGNTITGVTFDIYGNIWISNFNSFNSVLRFDVEKESFKSFPTNGVSPHGLGADEMGFIYTINYGSNDISKIDAETGEFVMRYPVGAGPYTYSDLTGFIYRHVTLNGKDN